MWFHSQDNSGGLSRFFYLIIGNDSLKNYYETNFSLMKLHNFSLSELDALIPWEKEAFIELLLQWIKSEKKRIELELRNRKTR